MATKPLQSITFPGLPDTYTVPQVDATLTTSGAAADAKIVGDDISDLNERIDDLGNLEVYVEGTSLVINTILVNGNEVEY